MADRSFILFLSHVLPHFWAKYNVYLCFRVTCKSATRLRCLCRFTLILKNLIP